MALSGFGAALSHARTDPPPPHPPLPAQPAPVRADFDASPAILRPRVHRVRPWQRVHALRDTLESALPAIADGVPAGFAGALDAVRGAGAELQRLCALDPDAMLAVPLLLEGGRYGVRHAIATAVVLEFMLARHGAAPPERRTAVLAALTMNVGMLALQETLYTQAGPLSAAQRAAVLAHPRVGVVMLRAAGVDDPLWLAVVARHHEHLDGTGYPARLAGDEVGVDAQALMIAERWCAMVAPRAYRPGAPPDQALHLLLARVGGEADPMLAAHLADVPGPLPPGTPVRLANGELGIVFRRTRDPSAPRVLVLRASDGTARPDGVPRDTAEPRQRIEGCVAPSAVGVGIRPDRIWEAAEVVEPEPVAG